MVKIFNLYYVVVSRSGASTPLIGGSRKKLGRSNFFLVANCKDYRCAVLRKIIKIVVTGCHRLKLKCTKFDFGDSAGAANKAPRDSLAS